MPTTSDGFPIDPSGLVFAYYIGRIDADVYFANRLNSNAWLDAVVADRDKALIEATRAIDRLNFCGEKKVSTQYLQFPRLNRDVDDPTITTADTEIPADIKAACCEIAIKLLDGVDVDEEAELVSKTSQGYGGARSTYDRSFVPEWKAAGIPSPRAWALLKPYVRDYHTINLSRVN